MAGDTKMVNSSRLRFGIICTGDVLPAAYAKCLAELLSTKGVELALLIIGTEVPDAPWQTATTDDASKRTLWSLYARSHLQRLACFTPVDMSQTFAAVPRIDCCTVCKGKVDWYFRQEDIQKIHEYELDFILQFTFGTIAGEILRLPRYGVWSFHYGDEMKFRGGPPAFWEIYHDEPVTGASLQRLRPSGGVVLQKGFIEAVKHSYGDNLNALMWASTYMPARVCRDILRRCGQRLDASPSPTHAPIFQAPSNFEMIAFYWKITMAWLKRQLTSVFLSDDWNIGIVHQPIHAFLDPNFQPRIEWLAYQKPYYFLADPFLLNIGPKLKLFAEELDRRSGRGCIVETDLNDDLVFPLFRKVLDEGVHMSYPYLFEHEGRYYCTPEASEKRKVCLYAFDAERDAWTLEATLIENFAGVDPTVFQHAGQWWLFCSDNDNEIESKLFIWHAARLLGPWEPHAANPVKMDVRSSRPAGRPFVFEGRLYRPAQDCSKTYGGAITINCVTRLTTQEFSEEPAARVEPVKGSRYHRGIHTLVGHDSITVVDGKRWVFSGVFAWHRIEYKLRRFLGKASA